MSLKLYWVRCDYRSFEFDCVYDFVSYVFCFVQSSLLLLLSMNHSCCFSLHCFYFFTDEQCEATVSSTQPHPFPSTVWGAGKQSASRYPGSKCRMWRGQEEPLLRPLTGAGAAAGELHECRLSKCSVIWLWPQFTVQGKDWNADHHMNCSCTVHNLSL